MTSGVFFRRRAAGAGAADPARLDLTGQQLAAAPGHRARIHAQQLGDRDIPAVTDLGRLQPGVESALPLVEQAAEQHDRSLQLVWHYPHPPAQAQRRRLRIIDGARGELATAGRRVAGQVDIATGDALPRHSPGPHQAQQCLLAVHLQHRLALAGVVAGLGRLDQCLNGRHQGAELGEEHRPERPQPEGVEAGDLGEGVETTAVRVAGVVVNRRQLAEHRGVGGGAQCLFQLGHGGNCSLPQ